LTKIEDFGAGMLKQEVPSFTLLPDPPRAPRFHTLISVDDHLVEPRDTFEGRLSSKFAERAPRVIETDDGLESWFYDGRLMPQLSIAATAGRPVSEWGFEPARFDQMRPGAWDIHARIQDMNIDGVYASLNFPSFLCGFGGGRLQTATKDLDLALAVVRAWNDWHVESWAGTYPDRIIPCQIPWLHDPVVGAKEVRRNAERGVRAISFPEDPAMLGMPSIFTNHWDPILDACQETGTVVCLHTGSGGSLPSHPPNAPSDVYTVHFGSYAVLPTIDWLFSLVPLRFPDIRIAMSEGGIGWVMPLIDRLNHGERIADYQPTFSALQRAGISPKDLLLRNFWFCALDDPSSIGEAEEIGSHKVMIEADYPHPDSSWPNTQSHVAEQMSSLSEDSAEAITWRNASALFEHPVPDSVIRDPNDF
jgi:predicted TIM-barrel fold metal-dependent hydrolase